MIAAENDHVEMVKMLLSYGAEPNLISRKSGNTALHSACRTGKPDSIKALLEAGAFVNVQRPTTGETPLHEALKHGFPVCAEILIEAGANKDVIAFDGKRPADVAAEILGPNAPILAQLS
jgi:ankyrin repeat protein